ncbi:hypothetical protein SPRG_09529 [Saprolegnia parasitica CBS 223.65]|uniref:Uncharacterized protein n=1 Tax=Saprolegnia parasitica (strain CBS 223.65) TaxID=695850 RepID=A0A067C6T9_SAPPC|nr:hypothetical protein SPRG_09529 [Saprolegnia parasitica CBS 223.65]KDO24885.1 hypothetical protein SPRG_09529 [Saprolegnia parasitica CBS 223.65]|eukprot:XP_012204345.1 hypothetical protein SPRG_09529 [Saprolegnia parasitica CBS 223.65]
MHHAADLLCGDAALSADWTGEYEEKSAQWFELFLDLIMVAACSNVAEGLKDDLSLRGAAAFVLLCLMYASSWHLYTHFNARFSESSLLHYGFLYVLLIGLGGMVLASEPGRGFTIGLVCIRAALLCMNLSVFWSLPNVRGKAGADMSISLLVMTLFAFALYVDYPTVTIGAYLTSLVLETLGGVALVRFANRPDMDVAMNIDHVDDREGCLVMVALGESVVSTVMHRRGTDLPSAYYVAMALSLLVIFSLAIFYFAAKPQREMHAMRRSIATGLTYSLLAIGVGTKLVSEAVRQNQELAPTSLWVLFGSMSLAFCIMLLVRLLHYGGRQTDPLRVQRIKYVWWGVCALSPICPPVVAYILQAVATDGGVDPITALACAAAIILSWLVSETAVMHSLRVLGYGYSDALHETTTLESRASLLVVTH